MNKKIWIALSVLLILGISYQAKRSYDLYQQTVANQKISENNSENSNAQNGATPTNPADSTAGTATNPGETNSQTAGAGNENNSASNNASNGSGNTNPQGATGENGNAVSGTGATGTSGSETVDHAANEAHPGNTSTPGGAGGVAKNSNGGGSTNGVGNTNTNSNTSANAKNQNGKSVNGAGSTGGVGATIPGGVPGISSNSGGSVADKAAAKLEAEKAKNNCFAFEYRHKKEAKDQDIENFLDYTNAFPIARADYNPKSLCVKVNQKAVNYTLAKAKSGVEVRVGSMVGPESVIRVSYCVGKISPCHEACVQPKKRFMDDMMNDAGDEDTFTDSWGKDGDEKNKKDLKEKSKELRVIASENDHLNEGAVQRNWDELEKQEWVCKK